MKTRTGLLFVWSLVACSFAGARKSFVLVSSCRPLGWIAEPRGTRPEIACQGHADGLYVINPQACNDGFYKCANGHSYYYQCPQGLFFSTEDAQCEYKQTIPGESSACVLFICSFRLQLAEAFGPRSPPSSSRPLRSPPSTKWRPRSPPSRVRATAESSTYFFSLQSTRSTPSRTCSRPRRSPLRLLLRSPRSNRNTSSRRPPPTRRPVSD